MQGVHEAGLGNWSAEGESPWLSDACESSGGHLLVQRIKRQLVVVGGFPWQPLGILCRLMKRITSAATAAAAAAAAAAAGVAAALGLRGAAADQGRGSATAQTPEGGLGNSWLRGRGPAHATRPSSQLRPAWRHEVPVQS